MVLKDVDVYRVGVAEQVVHVAQNLLISAHEEDAQVVVLSVFEFVDGQRVGNTL